MSTNQLKTQLGFIERSCFAYDQGNLDEALRIAVALRVLFHDTNRSESLLKQLGKKEEIKLISSFGTGQTKEELQGTIFINIPVFGSGSGVSPPLEKNSKQQLMSIELWWNEVVMSQNQSFSRKDVVLAAANQDGGAHVDSNPNRKTMELKDGVGTLTITRGNTKEVIDMVDHHLPLIRQFGYEVLHSNQLLCLANT